MLYAVLFKTNLTELNHHYRVIKVKPSTSLKNKNKIMYLTGRVDSRPMRHFDGAGRSADGHPRIVK